MDIGIYYDDVPLQSRIDYVINFLSHHPMCPKETQFLANPSKSTISISYGAKARNCDYTIPVGKNFFSIKEASCQDLISNSYSFEALILNSVEKEKNEIISFLNTSSFGFDFLETIFFHISRLEEYFCSVEMRNKWDTMKSEEMFLVKFGLEKNPVVDHIVYAFFKCLGIYSELWVTKKVISHDIDHIRKFKGNFSLIKKLMGHIRRGEFGLLKKWKGQVEQYKRDNKDPYDVFDWLLIPNAKDGENTDKMIFYLMGGDSVYDTPIPPGEVIFLESINKAKERGYSIGTHPSYNAWTDDNRTSEEKKLLEKIIEQPITISRQHYLHFKFPTTIRVLEKNAIELDSSLGYYDRIGFRCGTGFKYKLYDLIEDRITDVWELPLVFMDSAVIREAKRTGDTNSMIQITNIFLEQNKYFTCITCNFHNSRFDEAEMRGWPLRMVYEKFTKTI
jgi:hypothetical protein